MGRRDRGATRREQEGGSGMTPADAMAALDALVADEPEPARYRTARTLYAAALAGLLTVPISAGVYAVSG